MTALPTTLERTRLLLGPPGSSAGEWDLTYSGPKIMNIRPSGGPRTHPGAFVDCRGLIAAPGFIDLHVHGAMGADFMDATEDVYDVIGEYHARGGTTAWLPTTASDSLEALTAAIDLAARCRQQQLGPVQTLGVHIEGPYFNPNKNGCHDRAWVRPPSPVENRAYLERAHIIRRITCAPELPGALEFIGQASQAGILISGGHSEATAAQVAQAVEQGMRMITHLFSAMSSIVKQGPHRIAGMLEAALLEDRLATEVIADMRHAPRELLLLAFKAKAKDSVCFTTDAMRGAGMPDGTYTFGSRRGTKAIVENGVARNLENTGFASSTSQMIDLVRNGVEALGFPLEDSVRYASLVPAKILGIERQKGTLEVGKDADIVLLASQPRLSVKLTLCGGKVTYRDARATSTE